MQKIATVILCTITSLFFFCSCENGYDCSLENVAYNRIAFYDINDYGTESKYQFPEVLTVSLMVNGSDSIVVNHIQNADILQLPMSYTNECDTVIFNYGQEITDTIYVRHKNIPFYISMECGTVMYHRIEEVTHTNNLIDSIAIEERNVNFDYNENIKLYFFN